MRARSMLRASFGDRCHWCGGEMEFVEIGKIPDDLENMATIEHEEAKKKGDRDNPFFWRLAHKRCNK